MPTRLPSLAAQRQREAVRRADAVADAAERAVHRWWRELLALLRRGPQLGVGRLHLLALQHFRRLPLVARGALRAGLTELYGWSLKSARQGVLRELPRRLLPVLAARGIRQGRRLTEDRAPLPNLLDYLFSLVPGPGILDAIPDDLLLQLILPTPPEHVIRRRVEELIAPFLATPRADLVPPEGLANILIQGYSQGKNQQEIAKDLLPHVDGVRASARRVARTWGIHVAQESQFEAHESLGADLVIGYEIHATPGPYSRPWHQERDGTIYYREPQAGQKGFAQLPRPPREAPDPAERPPGTPAIAWN